MNESYQNWQPMETPPENGWVELMDASGMRGIFLIENKKISAALTYLVFGTLAYVDSPGKFFDRYLQLIKLGERVVWTPARPVALDAALSLLQRESKYMRRTEYLIQQQAIAIRDLQKKIKELKGKECAK